MTIAPGSLLKEVSLEKKDFLARVTFIGASGSHVGKAVMMAALARD